MAVTIPVKFKSPCNNKQCYIKTTPANIKNMALDLWHFLCKMECQTDAAIYFKQKDKWNRIAYYSAPEKYKDKTTQEFYTKHGANDPYYYTEDVEPTIEWTGDVLYMVFEGPLYYELNYESTSKMPEYLDNYFSHYGLYYEMGYAWSFALYEI